MRTSGSSDRHGHGTDGRCWHRLAVSTAAAAALVGSGVLAAPTATAEPVPLGLTATGPTAVVVAVDASTPIPGVSIAGAGGSDTLNVTISTTVGSLTLPTTTGLTAANDYMFSGPIISFTGRESDVDADLAALALTPADATPGAPATIAVSAYVDQPGFIYSPSNQHFYKFVSTPGITWAAARTAAATTSYTPTGLSSIGGYLSTIPNATVNALIADHVPGASNFWLSAEAFDNVPATGNRQWRWVDGPLAGQVISNCASDAPDVRCSFDAGSGYSSWDSTEPNNYGGAESVAVDNVNGNPGLWNDLDPSSLGSGYLVEYGNQVTGSSGGTGVATAAGEIGIYAAPAAPTAVTVTRHGTSATVSWALPSSTGGYPLTGSTVTAGPGGATCRPATPTGTSCTISGLPGGTTYTFSVAAANAYATGAAATATLLVPGRPGAVRLVRARALRRAAVVSWSTPAEDGGAAISGYRVVFRDTSRPAGTVTVRAAAGTTTATAALTAGDRYSVSVVAVNRVGLGVAGTSSTVVPFTNPQAPTALTAKVGTGSARLHWAAPHNTGYTPITGYRVDVADLAGGATSAASLGRVLGTVVTGLIPGHTYTFAVAALNVAGASPAARRTAVLLPPYAVSATERHHEIAVPADPLAAHGPVRTTVADGRSHNGTAAFDGTSLNGYQLHARQAVDLSSGALFGYDSARLTAAGRAVLRSLVVDLQRARVVTCEGYTDYQVDPGHAMTLSTARARAVCGALKADGAHIRTTAVGYGGQQPVAVGGAIRQRGANRRVLLYLDR